ncbi:MAG: EamA family transporter [Alkalispirochaetaceae bacterium]
MQNLFAVLLAFLAYAILNVSQATQKDGIDRIRKKRGYGWTVWWIGTVGTAVPFFMILGALNMGNVSLVGAMAGTGLPVMTLFSHFVLGEEVDRRQILGIGLILAGGAVVGLFAPEASSGTASFRALIILSVATPLALLLVWYIKYRLPGRDAWILGALAGSFAGISVLFQEAATTEKGRALGRELSGLHPIITEYAPILLNPISAVWIGATLLAFGSSQAAYARGDSVRVVPPFVAAQIVVPILGGLVAFSETLAIPQWFAVAAVLAGLPLVTGPAGESK